ncbi:class I SAM-dependent methyltransferase [Butyrivibrio sp. NC2007]|uniref:class I SAM-dependent methyltransferase n=1 Tax=Butyrivibrio sp. NC2007 TaxID=1280683 RepID=UPI0003B6ACEB|nr:class I SAM-dependent methyltransferase [Butyrivibrio sp. NC2007]
MEKHNLGDWLEALLSKIGYGAIDRKNKRIKKIEDSLGVDFGGQLFQNDLGFDENQGNDYTASPDWILSVLDSRITNEDSIVDFGCGKGYAMYLMTRFPFKKIYGIELSKKLYEIALHNFTVLSDERLEIWNEDATNINSDVWNKLITCNYIYIYNSFPYEVMKKVVKELEDKVVEKSWQVSVIYVSPTPECRLLLDRSNLFKLCNRYFESASSGGVFEYQSLI